jgi:cell division protein FtsN
MARNEEGEFELILGNKQLLSVFFIVVVLLGVFFAMGYIMGRNTSVPVEQAGPTNNPISVSMDKPSAMNPGSASLADPPARPIDVTAPSSEKKTEETVVPEKKAEEKKAEEKKIPEKKVETAEKKADEKKASKKAELPPDPPPSSTPSAAGAPPTGTFLQVVAAKKPEAELISRVLVTKGYRAWVTPVEKKDLFRVLVGPVKDPAQAKKFTEELRAQGFQPIPRKL